MVAYIEHRLASLNPARYHTGCIVQYSDDVDSSDMVDRTKYWHHECCEECDPIGRQMTDDEIIEQLEDINANNRERERDLLKALGLSFARANRKIDEYRWKMAGNKGPCPQSFHPYGIAEDLSDIITNIPPLAGS